MTSYFTIVMTAMISSREPRPAAWTTNTKKSNAASAMIKDVRFLHPIPSHGLSKGVLKPKFGNLDSKNCKYCKENMNDNLA